MPARLRNFIIDPAADFVRVLAVADSDGEPLDLSADYSATLTLYTDAGAVLASWSASDGLELGNGTIGIDIDSAVLDALDLSGLSRTGTLTEPAPPLAEGQDPQPDYIASGRLAAYDLHLTSASGDEYRLLKGQICFANR